MEEYHHLRPDRVREQTYKSSVHLSPAHHQNLTLLTSTDRRTPNVRFSDYQAGSFDQYCPSIYKTVERDENSMSKDNFEYTSGFNQMYKLGSSNIPKERWKNQEFCTNGSYKDPTSYDINKTLDLSISIHDGTTSDRSVHKSPISENVQYRENQNAARECLYQCGGCHLLFDTVSNLHDHLLCHIEGGSYFYNHHTRVAFPKYDAVCKETQTAEIQVDADKGLAEPWRELFKSEVTDHRVESDRIQVDVVGTKLISGVCDINEEQKNPASDTTGRFVKDEIEGVSINEIKTEDEENKLQKCDLFENNGEMERENDIECTENSQSNQVYESDGETDEYIVNENIKHIKKKRKQRKKKHPEVRQKKKKQDIEATLPCKICQQSFKKKVLLQRHVKKEHKKIKNICLTCSEQFQSEVDLYAHRKTVHAKTVHQCELCNKVLSTKGMLEGHYLVHKGIKPFSCDLCNPKREFTRKSQLQAHMQTHSDVKHLQCEFCGKPFNARYLMINHVKHCGGIKPHKCEFCDMRFVSNHCLQRHRRTHTGEKPYVCEVCAFASGNASCLARHMRTHTGEKPFTCQYCHQTFAAPGALKKHVRIHTQEKPYVCSYCNKGFTQKWNLKTHERQHTGETPYQCKVCGVGYKQNVLLKTHLKTHYDAGFNCNADLGSQQVAGSEQGSLDPNVFSGTVMLQPSC